MSNRILATIIVLNAFLLGSLPTFRLFSHPASPAVLSSLHYTGGDNACTHTKKFTANCMINQDPNNNPCPVNESTCSVSTSNPAKCISVTKTTENFGDCRGPRMRRGEIVKTWTDCSVEASGYSCATVKTGDVVNGSCESLCTSTQGTCGSGVRVATETQCEQPGG